MGQIIFRKNLGRPLSVDEADNNYRYIELFSDTRTYLENMVVIESDKIYRALIDITTPGPFIATQWQELGAISGSTGNLLGTPTDGQYGQGSNVPNVIPGDTVEDGIDKIISILDQITPPPPPRLQDINLILQGAFSAFQAGQPVPTLIDTVTTDTSPTITSASEFGDANSGDLIALIDTVAQGQVTLTAGDDSGSASGVLTITSENPFPATGNSITTSITARIDSTFQAPSATPVTYELEHSLTGTSSLDVYIDNPATPIITTLGTSLVGIGGMRYISGVPSMDVNETVRASFTVSNAVSNFYNETRIARIESNFLNDADVPLPTTPPAANSVVNVTNFGLTVLNGVYTETLVAFFRGYNSAGTITNSTVNEDIRIDTISDESARLTSGVGQYPTVGFGTAFNSVEDLNTAGNEELQLLNGSYRFPSGDFSSNLPVAGPNYTGLAGGTFSNRRWATFSLGNKTNINSISFEIRGATNMGTDLVISQFSLYVQVEGDTSWVDANATYPGAGSPSANGDPALDASSSSTTNTLVTRRVTFGPTSRSGRVLVRIGLPFGSTKTFQNIVEI